MTKSDRQKVFDKFNGKCAYSGTYLTEDWQVDHLKPLIRNIGKSGCHAPENECLENLMPCQKLVNHYKGSLDLETFRTWYLGELHLRLAKLPKRTKSEKAIKKIKYLNTIAELFGISIDKPFNGIFYFETLRNDTRTD